MDAVNAGAWIMYYPTQPDIKSVLGRTPRYLTIYDDDFLKNNKCVFRLEGHFHPYRFEPYPGSPIDNISEFMILVIHHIRTFQKAVPSWYLKKYERRTKSIIDDEPDSGLAFVTPVKEHVISSQCLAPKKVNRSESYVINIVDTDNLDSPR